MFYSAKAVKEMLNMNTFYSANSSQQIDQYAIEHLNIPGILLMKQAGLFAFQVLQKKFSPLKHITVLCGTGNNGGDGFIVAQLAAMSGLNVTVCLFGDPKNLHGDALIAYQEMQEIGLSITPFSPQILQQTDVIIDALFGTGLDRPITGAFFQAIEQVNQSNKPVLALDIPSGLHADTGCILGTAIQATHTCTFITQKFGLYSYQGADVAGTIHYSPLFLDQSLNPSSEQSNKQTAFQTQTPLAQNHSLSHWLKKHPTPRPSQHKGQAGTVCLVGGNHNMMGAIQLAASASLHTGAGLVKVITQAKHTLAITQQQPELMCYTKEHLATQLQHAQAVALGPGLGQDDWANALYQTVLNSTLPKILDADALRLLALAPQKHANWILTPHPGEAAQLLNTTPQAIQSDRLNAIKALQTQYGGVVVLKGNGTLIYDGKQMELCLAGNAGMAVGGMGDTLTGAITTFVAQGLPLWDAACLGVSLHAHAGDQLAQQKGQSGVLPSELALIMSHLLK